MCILYIQEGHFKEKKSNESHYSSIFQLFIHNFLPSKIVFLIYSGYTNQNVF